MRNLITAQEVIELAFAENSNMREESISATSIHIAEIKYIRPAFGDMYALLSDKYADFTNDYVKPALAYFVKCEIVSSIAIDMSNSGIAVANPQYQSAASDKQRQRLYDSEMSKAKALLDFALEYIATHSSDFPDFSGNAPKKHHRVGGLILGNGPSVKTSSIAGEAFKGEIEKLNTRVDDLEERIDDIGGGGNSDNNYTDADKALVQTIPSKLDRREFEEFESETAETLVSITQGIESIGQDVETKADEDGYYPDMSVGMADNLVGRGDVQDAHINFRPSAGADNISDGAARIERIKGNSVVYNQLYKNGTTWSNVIRASVSRDGNNITISATENQAKAATYSTPLISAGHKAEIEIEASVYGRVLFGVYRGNGSDHAHMTTLEGDGSPRTYKIIQLQTNDGTLGFYIPTAGDSVEFDERSIKLADLTKEFGAGNEPTTVEEYLQRKPMNIEDEYAHNAGTLVDMKVDSLISTSDNAYNPLTHKARVLGGKKYDITTSTSEIPQVEYENDKGEIGADFERVDGKYVFPTDGYLTFANADELGDICVCLSYSYPKPHPPYQQEVKDLSFISEAFPNGMRSVGSAYDEIRFNPTKEEWEKVTRIGVVDLGSLGWKYFTPTDTRPLGFFYASITGRAYGAKNVMLSSYATTNPQWGVDKSAFGNANGIELYIIESLYTDATTFKQAMQEQGVMLYYELAEPIVEPIDLSPNFNPDYLVWDFGTEEAIASVPSAPFRADINYEPNAVDDLRWAVDEIRKLKAQLAQVQTSVTNLTEE